MTTRPVLRSYQVRLSASVATPSWTMRLSLKVLRLDLAALFLPEPDQRRLVGAHDDPRVRAADEAAAVRLYRMRSRDKVVQCDFHWGPRLFADIERCDIGTCDSGTSRCL